MRRFLKFILPVALALAICSPAGAATHKKKKSSPQQTQEDSSAALQKDANGVPIVRAASVYVIEAKTGQVLYQKNAGERRPPASTQKLLTALIIAESGNLDDPVRVEQIDTEVEPVKLGFKPGEIYTRRELLEVLLVHSTNDVARCLARDNAGSVEAFANRMNRRAAELGMFESHFVNPNGLPAPAQYSTARDMSKIAKAAYANRTIRGIVATKTLAFRYADGHVRTFENTNRVLKAYPYCNGMKTGYTEAAGKCLIASGTYAGRDIIAVVLGDKTPAIWRDAYQLLAWGLSI
jgi:D-alanyl-D-alanine carboxypeptidase (penicillin-binding protein 5/6)